MFANSHDRLVRVFGLVCPVGTRREWLMVQNGGVPDRRTGVSINCIDTCGLPRRTPAMKPQWGVETPVR